MATSQISPNRRYDREIIELRKMQMALSDWQGDKKKPIYLSAVRVCSAAQQGTITFEQARRAFASFNRESAELQSSDIT